jgi:hypothetical protein
MRREAAIMICPALDKKYERLDAVKAAHQEEPLSVEVFMEEMRCIWEIQAHASHGHNDEPCPGDWAQMYNRRQ